MSTYTFTTIATGRISIDAGTFNAAPDSSQVVLTWDKANRVSLGFLGITLNIDATKDTVVIDGTSHAPNFYTGATLYSALVALFPKANTGSGGSGTTGATGPAGVGVSTAVVDGSGHLILTKTDSSTVDAGNVVGPQGATGATGPAGADGAVVNAALTPTAVKTSAYTAQPNELVKVDASSGTVPITLPTAPTDKTRVGVKMIAVAGSNTTTIAAGGSAVFNKAAGSVSISLTLLNQAVIFQYEAATGIWNVVSGDIPLSGLDGRFASAGALTTTNSNVTKNNAAITQRNAVLSIKLLAFLTADTSLKAGSATISFTRSLNSSFLLSTGLYGDATNNVAAFTFDSATQGNRLKMRAAQVNNLVLGASNTSHRDLTQTEWAKTNCTAAKTQTGVDGVANSTSSISATADAATALFSITVASATRTFSAFIKRIAGGGRVAITRDGGTTLQDITVQCLIGTWTRVSLTTTAANPVVGFWLEKSGAAIAVDAVNDTDTAIMYDPCIVRAQDRRADTLIYSSISPAIVAGGRYYMSADVILQGTGSSSLKINTGSATDEVSVAIIPTTSFLSSYIKQAGVFKVNNTTANLTARINLPVGTRLKVGLVWGISQMSVLVNDALHYYWDSSYFASGAVFSDISSLNNLTVQGDIDVNNVQIAEVTGNNLMLLGDSMTANTDYHEMFRNALNPLDWTVFGRGVAGNTIADVQSRLSTDVTPYYWSKAYRNVMFLRIGTNSLANNIDAATCLTQLQALVNAILAAHPGWRIKLITCIPSRTAGLTGLTTSQFTTQANLYNAGLSSITGIDSVIDLTGVIEAGDATDNTYYNGDGIHPNFTLNNIFKPILLKNIW